MTGKELSIVEYIKSLNSDVVEREAIFRHMREVDPEISHADVSSALRSLGYAAKRMKGSNPSGICSRWVRESNTEEPQPDEPNEPKGRTTEEVVSDVEARNATNIELNRRLLETLQISRNLKQEMMEKQVNALVSMARMILAIHGDSYEQQRYKP